MDLFDADVEVLCIRKRSCITLKLHYNSNCDWFPDSKRVLLGYSFLLINYMSS